MDFTYDDTQGAVANLAATVLRSEPDHARVDHVVSSSTGCDETLWKAMAQAGLLALALPTRLGGDGMGAVEIGAVLAEVGRQVLPVPAYATLALGVLPVVASGNEALQDALLPEVADGRILTAAIRDASPSRTITRDGQFVVTATKIGVPFAAQAHRILVSTEVGVLVLDPAADGVRITRTPTSTGAPEYTVTLDEVYLADDALLDADAAPLHRYALAGAVALADGVLAGALALTAAHIGTREQFGKPLATFQAVAGQIADVYITARTINLAALSSNWRLAQGLDVDDELDIAGYWLAAEVPSALQTCHHLHGGLGVDVTYPLHRFYAHGKDLARAVGGSAYRLDEIGARCSSN